MRVGAGDAVTIRTAMKPKFFATPQAFRKWLERHGGRETELWVGFYKKDSGKPSITWPESVDAALCFGWIDGLRKSLDDSSYVIRFTPRKPDSRWSLVNVNRVRKLAELGLMSEAGNQAFAARTQEGTYSYEQRAVAELSPAHARRFRKNKAA